MRLKMNSANRVIGHKVTEAIKDFDYEEHFLRKLKEIQQKKAKSTIKDYAKHGYNTQQWLVKTGKSTEVKVRREPNGVHAEPVGKTTLKNVARSDEWFSINDSLITKILTSIRKLLR